MIKYEDFLAAKRSVDPMTGLDKIGRIPKFFKPHQSDITKWALRRGRAAIFAGTGLGKTLMELEWSRQVSKFTGKPVLILAPLAVSTQHVREGEKFGIHAKLVRQQFDVTESVSVTNYQKLDHFDLSQFGGICLTPFLGIGSEVVSAISMDRKGVGFELKASYFSQAVRHCAESVQRKNADGTGLFNFAAEGEMA